jgi:hypothetical protein
VTGFDLAQKGRAGDANIMKWTMIMTTMARGGSKGKSINDSISEHKSIVTSNIIYSINVIIPINNNCRSVSITILQVLTESNGIPLTSFHSRH